MAKKKGTTMEGLARAAAVATRLRWRRLGRNPMHMASDRHALVTTT
jgi:hypothetical protein